MTTLMNQETERNVAIATVGVFEPGLQYLREKTAELNKRAARHGMNTMAVRVVRVDTFIPVFGAGMVFDASTGRRVPKLCVGPARDYYRAEITGSAPRIDGWELAARVEFSRSIGNVVRIAPGRDDDGSYVAYRTVGPVCEHCNSHRNRNDIFVLEHVDGRRKIVGRNCLADFLRCEGADKFALSAKHADLASQWARDVEEGEGDFDGYVGGVGIIRLCRLSAI